MEPARGRLPELRLFDSTDLPQHKGDFTSQHSIMVRTRQFAEIAGLMDGTPGDQPTLKRFSRYNQSMHSRPSTTSMYDPSSSQSAQPQTYSKGGKLKTGIFSGNWTLRDKKEMRPSVHNITVVPIGRQSATVSTFENDRKTPAPPSAFNDPRGFSNQKSECTSLSTGRERLIPIAIQGDNGVYEDSSTLKSLNASVSVGETNSQPTFDLSTRYASPMQSRREMPIVRVKKSESCDDMPDEIGAKHFIHPQRFGTGDTVDSPQKADDSTDEFDEDDHNASSCRTADRGREEPRSSGLMRRIGGVKSMGPTRRQWHRPIVEVFHARSMSKDSGLPTTPTDKRLSNCSSSTDERSPTPPSFSENFATHLVIDADSAYRTGTSDSSPSSICSNGDAQSSTLRKSCPDLRQSSGGLTKNLEAHRVLNQRNRRAREKRQAALWMKKPILEWSLDDVLLWLQHCKLDEVASIMIGYDMTGADVDKWNNDTLAQLGVNDAEVRRVILTELKALRDQQAKAASEPTNEKAKSKQRVPLFKLVRSASYDKVLAVETCLTTRDITVAEGRFGCLQVTKVNGANIPLREQDCFLEINDMPGQAFRSPLMFTKLVSDAAGAPIRLVVLRRRLYADEDAEDNTTGNDYLQRTLHAAEQDSSASSGVSSSEISSDVVPVSSPEEKKPQVLRF